jgi:hypothetical protein
VAHRGGVGARPLGRCRTPGHCGRWGAPGCLHVVVGARCRCRERRGCRRRRRTSQSRDMSPGAGTRTPRRGSASRAAAGGHHDGH